MGRCFERAMGRPVSLNDPFRGGYITRSRPGGIPWVQIELSRAPFLSEESKRQRILAALQDFCGRVL
jgi:N-formylglutamate amidohydrolase